VATSPSKKKVSRWERRLSNRVPGMAQAILGKGRSRVGINLYFYDPSDVQKKCSKRGVTQKEPWEGASSVTKGELMTGGGRIGGG